MRRPAGRLLAGGLGAALLLLLAWLVLPSAFPWVPGRGNGESVRPKAKAVAPPATPVPKADGTAPEPSPEDSAAGIALPPPVDLEAADRERDLHGVVVDEKGRPVAGAALEVERSRPGRGWGDEPHLVPQPEPLRSLSASDGTFRFRLDWGEQADLQVRAEGFGAGRLHGCPAGTRVRVVLRRRGGALEVHVKDAEGAPIGGARVSVGGARPRAELTSHARGDTDAGGRFLCEGLAAGPVDVDASHPEFGDFPGVESSIPEEGRGRCEVVLDRGRSIEGRVVDAATDLPVPGARVGRNWVLERAVPTDAEGRFRFLGWNSVGGWHFGGLHCLAQGYARAEVEPPPEGPVEIRLVRGFRAEGRVVGADGRPVAQAKVEARGFLRRSPAEVSPRQDLKRLASASDGRFAFEDLRRDLPYQVSVDVQGHAEIEVPLAAPPEGVDVVAMGDLVLPSGRRVEGVVLDAAGKPAKEVEVSLSGRGHARVDDRGRFRIADVPPGQHDIYVLRPDAFVLLKTTVIIPAGVDVRDLALAIPAFRRLVVRVTDPQGRPLRGAEVYAIGEQDNDWKFTGEDGRVVLDQIKDEVVDVSAELYAPGNLPLRLQASVERVRPAGQEITLVMEEGVPISGVVLGSDGSAAGRVRVVASCAGREDERYWEQADENGAFHVRVRDGLSYDVEAIREDADGKVLERGTVRQVSGPREGLEIRLEPVKE